MNETQFAAIGVSLILCTASVFSLRERAYFTTMGLRLMALAVISIGLFA